MESRDGPAGDGREEHRYDREVLRIGYAVFERGELRNGVFTAEKQHHEDTEGHEQQREAENGVDAADNLVHGQQRGSDVIDEDDAQDDEQQPREIPERNAFERRNVEPVGNERRGLREEHGPHEDHQPCGKKAHDDLHPAAEIVACGFGQARAVVAERDDPGDEIVRRAHEDASEGDPQKRHGAVGGTEHRTEDRAEACDIQQLDQENAPTRQGHVIHTVIKSFTGSFGRRINIDEPFQIASVGKIGGNQQCKAHQESSHNAVSGQF